MDLVRKLLTMIESQNDNNTELVIPEELDRDMVAHHLELMGQAGLVKNKITYADDIPYWIFTNLTWNGHELLDSIRNESVWAKMKEGIKEKGLELGSVPFEVFIEYAKSTIQNMLGID